MGDTDSSLNGEVVEVAFLPVDPAAIRRRILHLECVILAIGLVTVGCAWFVYTYYGEAAPGMPFWKLALVSGVVVAMGMALVFAVSRLFWRRTTVGIAADSLIGPPIDPGPAFLNALSGQIVMLPYEEIGIVVRFIRKFCV